MAVVFPDNRIVESGVYFVWEWRTMQPARVQVWRNGLFDDQTAELIDPAGFYFSRHDAFRRLLQDAPYGFSQFIVVKEIYRRVFGEPLTTPGYIDMKRAADA